MDGVPKVHLTLCCLDSEHIKNSGCSTRVCACSVAQVCLTLCDPLDCSPPASSVHGIFQARKLEWVAISFSRGSSWPRDPTPVSCNDRWILYHCVIWEAQRSYLIPHKVLGCMLLDLHRRAEALQDEDGAGHHLLYLRVVLPGWGVGRVGGQVQEFSSCLKPVLHGPMRFSASVLLSSCVVMIWSAPLAAVQTLKNQQSSSSLHPCPLCPASNIPFPQ